MPRPKKELDKKYGLLTVVEEFPDRGLVRVRCVCTRVKDVQRGNLLAGRIRSCGMAGCRSRGSLSDPRARGYVRGPSWLKVSAIAKVWHDLETTGVEVALVAATYGVTPKTVYNFLTAVRAQGGIDGYIEALNQHNQDQQAYVPPVPVFLPEPPRPIKVLAVIPEEPPLLFVP